MAELFDNITRVFGSGLPRRRMLQLLAGVFAGGALPALWPARAAGIVQCATPFPGGDNDAIFVENCHTLIFPGDHDRCCNAALNRVSRANCPTTCPKIGGDWTCNSTCSETNPDKLVCAGAGSNLYCYCDAPPGKNCCGIGNYCTSGTQKCCGTFCGPIGQPCPNNPSPSR